MKITHRFNTIQAFDKYYYHKYINRCSMPDNYFIAIYRRNVALCAGTTLTYADIKLIPTQKQEHIL